MITQLNGKQNFRGRATCMRYLLRDLQNDEVRTTSPTICGIWFVACVRVTADRARGRRAGVVERERDRARGIASSFNFSTIAANGCSQGPWVARRGPGSRLQYRSGLYAPKAHLLPHIKGNSLARDQKRERERGNKRTSPLVPAASPPSPRSLFTRECPYREIIRSPLS